MKTILILALITISICARDNTDPIIGGGIHDSIRTYSRESLIKLALKMEDFERTKLNIKLLGGLHDYIYSLSKEKIISVVFDFVHRNPELDSISRIEELANIKPELNEETLDSYLHDLDRETLIQVALNCEAALSKKTKESRLATVLDSFTNEKIITEIKELVARNPKLIKNEKVLKVEQREPLSEEAFKARLSSYPQKYLVDLAISCENYKRSVTGEHLLGGLHDYAYTLEKERLIEIIVEFSAELPELRKEGYLEAMNSRTEHNHHGPILGRSRSESNFGSSLLKYDIEELKSIALSCESYERKKLNKFLIGGLHDYIDTLSAEELRDIIVEYANKYPELQENGFLESLSSLKKDPLTSSLDKLSMSDLKSVCLRLESYDRKKRNIRIFGGLHDYIDTLSRDDLYSYAKKMVAKNPELLSDNSFFGI